MVEQPDHMIDTEAACFKFADDQTDRPCEPSSGRDSSLAMQLQPGFIEPEVFRETLQRLKQVRGPVPAWWVRHVKASTDLGQAIAA
ncbi:hypothetical protein SZ64_14970 [Erythrobacter sp. SG61-1L]|nr:hypothetical protein SZ64_14970 [Erythrobacter sp. SG61-1L]